ncbi:MULTISPECIES: LptE family protein [unclassified Dysgonomonas]|uniref:LptE family protein n=1 Tax=unclassified Dysgonomonas TaxID=2630389 RepID=UPI00247434EE|nr:MULTISPECIES: LptE family protein [unclassified Dysgonomonas]
MKKAILLSLLFVLIIPSCSISYKFNGASINYDETPTIDIRDFQNQAPLVYPPLTQVFNERMKDVFTRNTKLKFTTVNPSLEIEGEIVRYDLTPQAVREDNFSSETRLTMAVKFRYRNNVRPEQDDEQTISAYRDFSSNLMLTDVQDGLIEELTKDIVDQIFNATMSNW